MIEIRLGQNYENGTGYFSPEWTLESCHGPPFDGLTMKMKFITTDVAFYQGDTRSLASTRKVNLDGEM